MNYYVEGKRGMGKSFSMEMEDIECEYCDYVAHGITDLGKHVNEEHTLVMLWSSPNFESELKRWQGKA